MGLFEKKFCSVCGEKETQAIEAKGHEWSEEFTVDVEPTCTTEGSNSYHCLNCTEKTGLIVGTESVEGIEMLDGTRLEVSGVFVIRPAVALGKLLHGLEIDGAHIVVDRKMATNKPGVFAAGDCTGRPYQLAKAVGEGNIAAHSIIEYLDD